MNCGIYGLWCGGCESHLLSFSCQGGGRGLRKSERGRREKRKSVDTKVPNVV